MQVTCPNCRARYAVDPMAIGPSGRTVQCVCCSHRWRERTSAAAAPPLPSRAAPELARRPSPPVAPAMPALDRPAAGIRWGRWLTGAVGLAVLAGLAAFAFRAEIEGRLPAAWRSLLGPDATTNTSTK